MELFDGLLFGFSVALSPMNLGLAFMGCLIGTVVGALPGLGPTNGVAVLIPVAFTLGLNPASSLILLTCVYYGALYGGRISSIMLNIPGDEPAVMTTLDGYPMAKSGKAPEALGISAVSSFIGATLATIGLTVFAPLLAQFALRFGPAEYVALFLMAFATIGGVTGANPAKTLLAACVGLALGTVGLDPTVGVERYSFGILHLYDGFEPIIALVGLFAISEFLVFLERPSGAPSQAVAVNRAFARIGEILKTLPTMLRCSVVGFVAGVLPGAGASLGSFLAYVFEKRWSDRGTFGKGDPRGVAAPEAGNNAAAGGALVPMLTLGVPGSGTTAIMLALLISLGISPGPLLFEKSPDLVWGLFAALYLANFVLLVMNLPLVGLFTRILALPSWFLLPFVVMVCFVGVYAINHSTFDLMVMTAFGVLGYLFRKLEISLVPVVLGLLLGDLMEQNLRRALSISGGDFTILFESPIALVLYAFTAVMLVIAVIFARRGSPIPSRREEDEWQPD